MKKNISCIVVKALAIAMLCVTPVGAANVALNADVTLDGQFWGEPAGTIVDGIYLPNMTFWQAGTVWWSDVSSDIVIDIGALHVITALNIQADNNDVYGISYMSAGGWVNLWTANAVSGFGMMTRPNSLDNSELFMLPEAVSTDKFMIQALSGDSSYSVSEFQAFGTPMNPSAVPEPSTLLLLAGALVTSAGLIRLRSK